MEYHLKCAESEAVIFAPHAHKQYEIVLILEGVGTCAIAEKQYPFREGTVMVIPPNTEHCSQTVGAGKRIYLQGDFESVLPTDMPFVIQGEGSGEFRQLLQMILRHRFDATSYVNALCHACLQWVVNHLHTEDAVYKAVQACVQAISDRYRDPQCNVTELLSESGYAVDYIRACFKRITGKTPIAFLTEFRVRQACFLMELYRHTQPLSYIAEQCGYADYAQFSKTFKAVIGCSPRVYLKERTE